MTLQKNTVLATDLATKILEKFVAKNINDGFSDEQFFVANDASQIFSDEKQKSVAKIATNLATKNFYC